MKKAKVKATGEIIYVKPVGVYFMKVDFPSGEPSGDVGERHVLHPDELQFYTGETWKSIAVLAVFWIIGAAMYANRKGEMQTLLVVISALFFFGGIAQLVITYFKK